MSCIWLDLFFQKTTVVYEKVQADEVTLSTDTSVGEEV